MHETSDTVRGNVSYVGSALPDVAKMCAAARPRREMMMTSLVVCGGELPVVGDAEPLCRTDGSRLVHRPGGGGEGGHPILRWSPRCLHICVLDVRRASKGVLQYILQTR